MLLIKPPIISYNLFLSSTNIRSHHSSAQNFLMASISQSPSKCAQYTSPDLSDFTSTSLLLDHSIPTTRPFLLSLNYNSSHKAFALKCPIWLPHCSPDIQGWSRVALSSLLGLCLNIIFLVNLSSVKLF